MWGLGDQDHFNLSIVKRMVELSHPFKLQVVEGLSSNKLVPCDQCLQSLWDRFSICLDFSSLTIEIANDHSEFTHILHRSLHHRHEIMKSELEKLTSGWIGKEGPFYLKVKNDHSLWKFNILVELDALQDTLQESDMQSLRNANHSRIIDFFKLRGF